MIEEKIRALSKRETEVKNLVLEGYTNGEIAEKLCISENTVKAHLIKIYDKGRYTGGRTEIFVRRIKELENGRL